MGGCIVLGLLASVAQPAQGQGGPPTLGEPAELMKLPKDDVSPVSFAQPFLRVSPSCDRCIYVRRTGPDGKAMLMIRKFGPPAKEFAALTAVPAAPVYWGWGFSGRSWRSDGLSVAYLLAGNKDGMEDEEVRHRLGLAHFDWDLPLPQQAGGGLVKGAVRSHTAVTYAAAGKDLWHAESDLKEYGSACVVGPRGVAYEAKGVAIHGLTTSPDDRLLAWTEAADHRKRARPADPAAAEANARAGRGQRPPPNAAPRFALMVMDPKARKVVHRVVLEQRPAGALVWAGGGKLLCFDDVAKIDRIFRAEVKALDLATGDVRLVVRDARPVGAAGRWLIVNRGPGCVPMAQHASSYLPPEAKDDRPRTDAVAVCDLGGQLRPRPLLSNAFAQQVVGRNLIYARRAATTCSS